MMFRQPGMPVGRENADSVNQHLLCQPQCIHIVYTRFTHIKLYMKKHVYSIVARGKKRKKET